MIELTIQFVLEIETKMAFDLSFQRNFSKFDFTINPLNVCFWSIGKNSKNHWNFQNRLEFVLEKFPNDFILEFLEFQAEFQDFQDFRLEFQDFQEFRLEFQGFQEEILEISQISWNSGTILGILGKHKSCVSRKNNFYILFFVRATVFL